MNILDIPLIARTRRNHALEHATIHVLSEHEPRRPSPRPSTACREVSTPWLFIPAVAPI